MAKTLLSNADVVTFIGLDKDHITQLQTTQSSDYEPVANKFLKALVNKIAKQKVASMEFSNPFEVFDGYPLTFGDTIENIHIEIARGTKYDKATDDPFTRSTPNVTTTYVTLNYEMQYQVTIEDKELRKAALTEGGFMQIVDRIIGSLRAGMNIDLYQAQIVALNNRNIYANGFEEISVPANATDTEKYKKVMFTLGSVYHDMQLPSIDNNKQRVMNYTSKKDLYIIAKQSVLDHINYDYLAGVFNIDKVELAAHIIPIRSFMTVVNTIDGENITPGTNGDDIDFVIVDKNGFDNHKVLDMDTLIHNPKKHYTNHWSTIWKIMSYRTDYQARAFKIVSAPGQ